MPNEFDSHAFILKLAQTYQKRYVNALAEYAKDDHPFQTVHGQIAKRIHNFSHLVIKTGETNSEDIFLQKNSAAKWKKI
jgi:hypothetical protein